MFWGVRKKTGGTSPWNKWQFKPNLFRNTFEDLCIAAISFLELAVICIYAPYLWRNIQRLKINIRDLHKRIFIFTKKNHPTLFSQYGVLAQKKLNNTRSFSKNKFVYIFLETNTKRIAVQIQTIMLRSPITKRIVNYFQLHWTRDSGTWKVESATSTESWLQRGLYDYVENMQHRDVVRRQKLA